MKLSPTQINSFLNRPNTQIRIVVVYGPDAGLVNDRAETIAHKIVPDINSPFHVSRLEGDHLINDAARLYNEMAMQSLGSGRKLVIIKRASDSITSAIGYLLANMPPGDSLVLVEAGDLEKRSKLRTIAESEDPRIVSIPCYFEDIEQRNRTAVLILERNGLHIENDALQVLSDVLPSDRLALRSELEKLVLFVHGKKTVSSDDVLSCLSNTAIAEIDDLIHAIAEGNAMRTVVLLDHLLAENVSPVVLLRAAQRHFMRLLLAQFYIDGGTNAKAAIEKLQPKVFWKHVEPMVRQVQRWKTKEIEKFLERLFEAEATIKKTGVPIEKFCAHVLLETAVILRS